MNTLIFFNPCRYVSTGYVAPLQILHSG
jgi:hypothetical protein